MSCYHHSCTWTDWQKVKETKPPISFCYRCNKPFTHRLNSKFCDYCTEYMARIDFVPVQHPKQKEQFVKWHPPTISTACLPQTKFTELESYNETWTKE